MDMTASWDAAAGKKPPKSIMSNCFVQTDRRLILVGSTYAEKGGNCQEADYLRTAAKKVPIFLINGYVEGENIYCFYGDDRQGAYDVTSALIRRGKQRILFLADSHTFSAQQKLLGYEQALSEAGYPILGDLNFTQRMK